MKIIIIQFIIAFVCINSNAQVCNDLKPVLDIARKITDKNKTGVFISQRVKSKTTGGGINILKNGSVYIGDLNDKLYHGKGIFIPSENDLISNCPGCAYFVGKFKNGEKNGKGICYNKDGIPIYIGKFADDKPVNTYPSSYNSTKYFADFKVDSIYYIGEMEGDFPYGFGAMFFDNGDFLISNFEDGLRKGISVCVEANGNWFTENIEGDKTTPISSSYEYSDLVKQAKSNFWGGSGAEFWANLSRSLNSFSKTLETIGSTNQYDNNTSHYESLSNKYNNIGKENSSQSKYSMSEQQAYNRDKSTYSKYDGMLSQYFSGNREATISEKNQWQKKMRDLRKKWEKKGREFPHYPNEDR